ncbi:mevalonate kinase [Candidatus Daviesbacteria bacterium]|nr:mevalonate kinase [Candidatus Daviesbacteria bacterium]
MSKQIIVSAPGKIHLLGEHFVVYFAPAILATVDLRTTVTIARCHSGDSDILSEDTRIYSGKDSGQARLVSDESERARMTEIVEPIIKKHLKIKTIPPYKLEISSQIPIGAGLGSSAAISAACIAALLSFLKVKWDLNLINSLTYEAEKVFHGNPSGGDNSTITFGSIIRFIREPKTIKPLGINIPERLAQNFVLINTGKPKKSTGEMVSLVKVLREKNPQLFNESLKSQTELAEKLLPVLKSGDSSKFIKIIRLGEKNLEAIGVVSKTSQKIIRKIEKAGGAAKICGAGSTTGPTGIILAYHPDKTKVEKIARSYKLPYFSTTLGVEGVRQE